LNIPRKLRNELPILALIIGSFTFYMTVLNRHPLIYGIDGPYYLIQVESLITSWKLKYGDPPLAFLIFALATVLMNGNKTLAIKTCIAISSTISAVLIYLLVRKIAGKNAGILASTIYAFNALHIRLMNDFLKNLLGIPFLLILIHSLNELTESFNMKRLAISCIALTLTYLTHILDFGVALLYLVAHSALLIIIGRNKRSIALKTLIANLACITIITVVTLAMKPELFTDIYKGKSLLREIALENEIHITQVFFSEHSGIAIIPTLIAGAILSFHELYRQRNFKATCIASITIVGATLSLPIIPLKWLWRFTLMEFIPASIIIGYGMSKIRDKNALIALAIVIASPILLQSINTSLKIGPIISSEELKEIKEMRRYIEENSVIIVRSPALYWVEYITGCNIIKRIDYDIMKHYNHIYMILHKIKHMQSFPPIPPRSKVIFKGKYFLLAKIK